MNLIQTIQRIHLFELADQIRDHPAGDLVRKHSRVDHGQLVRRQMLLVLGRNAFKVFAQLDQSAEVHA